MNKQKNEKSKPESPSKDLKVGEGFSDARGYIPEEAAIPPHNGLNVNNDPTRVKERKAEKEKRRS